MPHIERRKSEIEGPLSPPYKPTPVLRHEIVVTPEFGKKHARPEPASLLDPTPESSDGKGKAKSDKERIIDTSNVVDSYSPFQKRKNGLGSPRESSLLEITPSKDKPGELSFFFDVESQSNRPFWRKAQDYLRSVFGEPPAPAAGKAGKQNAKQQAVEQRTAKTFFANERTLLAWMNTATFLSLAGLTMINTQTAVGRFAGVSLTLITVGFALYALWKYMQRLYGLKGKTTSARLDDKIGPPILIISFCVVLVTLGIYFSVNSDIQYVKP